MRVLLQELLADLDIPAVHVTQDRDEALSIGDDLAVIADGQLRQTGLASQVAAEPANPDVARLLGWSELDRGTAARGTVQTGQLLLPGTAPADMHGPVHIFYRPEDVLLSTPARDSPASASLTAHIERILLTRLLARSSLAYDPPVTALLLHRDVERLRLQAGSPIEATLPPGSTRIFPAT
jgi:ABC-type Fe3+/spermidine/putrescine transport system ATPase subunit